MKSLHIKVYTNVYRQTSENIYKPQNGFFNNCLSFSFPIFTYSFLWKTKTETGKLPDIFRLENVRLWDNNYIKQKKE